MNKFEPEVVAQWVERDCVQLDFQPVRNLLTICLRERIPSYSSERIAELAEELVQPVSIALENRAAEYRVEGILASFAISTEDGASYFKALDRPEIELLKLLRQATPFAFEVFCKNILSKLNADAVVVGGVNDGGVDFYAIGLSIAPLVHPAPSASRVIVIGQSKRYTGKTDVGETDVRSFVGGSFKLADDLRRNHPDRCGLFTPLLLAFWTTGDFTPPAKKYARHLGIWYLNGVGLAQLATCVGLKPADVTIAEAEAQKILQERKMQNNPAQPTS